MAPMYFSSLNNGLDADRDTGFSSELDGIGHGLSCNLVNRAQPFIMVVVHYYHLEAQRRLSVCVCCDVERLTFLGLRDS